MGQALVGADAKQRIELVGVMRLADTRIVSLPSAGLARLGCRYDVVTDFRLLR
jgi:hypothetical protein